MKQRAILIFADSLGTDLARRRLPMAVRPLLELPSAADLAGTSDVHLFSSSGAASSGDYIRHRQRGRTFGEKLENAIERVAALGYAEIVVIGRDCPRLNEADIAVAFAALETQRLILGPDHRGGCYLIALRAIDRGLLHGIQWRQNTDCAQLRDRCASAEVLLLPVKHDVDSWADLPLLARGGDRLGRLVTQLLVLVSDFAQALQHFVDLAARHIQIRGQMPPPAAVG